MQSNLNWGIMVTFRMDACIAFEEWMLSNYFEEGPLLDLHTDFDFQVQGY